MEKTIRHVAVVLNGKAGRLLDCNNAEESLRDAFVRAGLQPSFISDAGSLHERILKAVKLRPDAVAVAGGDGTIACAASALVNSDIPLAILPCGTMNLLAKSLSLPINDLGAAIAVVARGRLCNLDVGEVNGHLFLCASMLGVPAWLGRAREENRGSPIRASAKMALAIWRQLLRTRRLRMNLVADGRQIPARAAALTITLNRVTDLSGCGFGAEGQFGIYIIDVFRLRMLLALALRVIFGRRSTAVREHLATEIEITELDHAVRVMNDGELSLLIPPLRYRLRHGALRVLAP